MKTNISDSLDQWFGQTIPINTLTILLVRYLPVYDIRHMDGLPHLAVSNIPYCYCTIGSFQKKDILYFYFIMVNYQIFTARARYSLQIVRHNMAKHLKLLAGITCKALNTDVDDLPILLWRT